MIKKILYIAFIAAGCVCPWGVHIYAQAKKLNSSYKSNEITQPRSQIKVKYFQKSFDELMYDIPRAMRDYNTLSLIADGGDSYRGALNKIYTTLAKTPRHGAKLINKMFSHQYNPGPGITENHYKLLKNKCSSIDFITSKNIYEPTRDGLTPLHICSFFGIDSMIKILNKEQQLKGVSRPYMLTDGGLNILHILSMRQNFNSIEYIIKKNKFALSSHHATQILYLVASYTNAPDVIKFWLARGAKVKSKKYPLLIATVSNLSKYFKDGGSIKRCPNEVINILIAQKTPLNYQDHDGNTALHLVAGGKVKWANNNCFEKIVHMLIKAGVRVNMRNKYGNTPLHQAAQIVGAGSTERVRMIIDAGAYVNSKNYNNDTPLHFIAMGISGGLKGYVSLDSHIVAAQLLLQKGAYAKVRNMGARLDTAHSRGYTVKQQCSHQTMLPYCGRFPLHEALLEGHVDMVKLLWPHTYPDRIDDGEKQSLLYILSRSAGSADTDLERFVLNKMFHEKWQMIRKKVSSLCRFIKRQSLADVRKILKTHYMSKHILDFPCNISSNRSTENSLDDGDVWRASPFWHLIHEGVQQNNRHTFSTTALMANMLIVKGADPNFNFYGKNALHVAVEADHTDMVKFLAQKHEVDVNRLVSSFIDQVDGSPLRLAVKNNYFKSVKILVNSGARINPIDFYSKEYNGFDSDIMCTAARKGNLDMVKFLYNRGGRIYSTCSSPIPQKQSSLNSEVGLFLLSECSGWCHKVICCLNKGKL